MRADGTPTHVVALVARGLSGVTAATWVSFSVLYSASYEADEIAPAVSRLMVPQYGSQIVAMLLGAQLAQRVGETAAFALAAAAALAGLLLMCRVNDRPPEGGRLTPKSLADVLSDRGLRVGTLLGTLFRLICWGTVLGFVPNWARDVAGLSVSQLGYLSVMYLLPNTVMARLSGACLAPRFGFRKVLTAGFALVGLACFLYPRATGLWPLLGAQAVFGVGMGLILPLTLATAIRNIPDHRRGAAMGVYQGRLRRRHVHRPGGRRLDHRFAAHGGGRHDGELLRQRRAFSAGHRADAAAPAARRLRQFCNIWTLSALCVYRMVNSHFYALRATSKCCNMNL